MADARKYLTLPGRFEMYRGGVLLSPTFAYETWGELNGGRDNAVLLLTGMSPSAHAASSPDDPSPGWWEDMVGPGKAVDTRRYFVVCVNSLGSCFGSTGPASPDPSNGRPYGPGFPELSMEDVGAGAKAVLDWLGIESLDTVIGPSMGGMSALAFLVMNPGISRRVVLVSTAARSSVFSTALRSVQRDAIRSDPAWNAGHYYPGPGPVTGMRLARKLGLITYRSALEWEQRFGRHRVAAHERANSEATQDFEIESYLEHNAAKFIHTFDANSYLLLSRATDLFDLAEHGGSVAAAVDRFQAAQVLVCGVTSDLLFPLQQQQELADAFARTGHDVQMVELPSIHGHDSFLVDTKRFAKVVGGFMESPPLRWLPLMGLFDGDTAFGYHFGSR